MTEAMIGPNNIIGAHGSLRLQRVIGAKIGYEDENGDQLRSPCGKTDETEVARSIINQVVFACLLAVEVIEMLVF
jgi:hypothetical protein